MGIPALLTFIYILSYPVCFSNWPFSALLATQLQLSYWPSNGFSRRRHRYCCLIWHWVYWKCQIFVEIKYRNLFSRSCVLNDIATTGNRAVRSGALEVWPIGMQGFPTLLFKWTVNLFRLYHSFNCWTCTVQSTFYRLSHSVRARLTLLLLSQTFLVHTQLKIDRLSAGWSDCYISAICPRIN